MAITRVGNPQTIASNNGNTTSITFLTAALPDDYVFAWGGNGSVTVGGAYGPSTAGYTLAIGSNQSRPHLGLWYKKMGSTPDTGIAFVGTGQAADAPDYGIIVLRGVDTTNPLDSTPQITTLTNPVGVTVNTIGAWVLAIGATSANTAPTAPPTGYTQQANRGGIDTNAIHISLATKEMTFTGVEDPGAWTWTLTSPNRMISAAIKPAGSGGGGGPIPFEGWGVPI